MIMNADTPRRTLIYTSVFMDSVVPIALYRTSGVYKLQTLGKLL